MDRIPPSSGRRPAVQQWSLCVRGVNSTGVRLPRAALFVLLSCLVVAGCRHAEPVSGGNLAPLPSREEIDNLVAPLLENGWVSGMVIGIRDPSGQEVFGYGQVSDSNHAVPNGQTLFEVGSITKVFTSLWLATLVERGVVKLDDPVESFLPVVVRVPSRNGKQITLRQLATHRSGLPRLTDPFKPADDGNPYADYTAEKLYAFLAGYSLKVDPGSDFTYSNLGVGLLGYALQLKTGLTYSEGIRTAITKPLGLYDTVVSPDAAQQARFAEGHNTLLEAVPHWTFTPGSEGAGVIRSTADDLLKFAAAEMNPSRTPLAKAIALSQQVQVGGDPRMGLGWFIDTDGMYWHNGGTGGFRACLMLFPSRQQAVVVLSSNTAETTDKLVSKILGLAQASAPHWAHAPAAPPIDLAPYVGTYELGPTSRLVITLRSNSLFGQVGTEKLFRLTRDGSDVFAASTGARVVFTRDGAGKVDALKLVQDGSEHLGKRVPVVEAAH